MPVISTSVSVSSAALNITSAGNYFVTAPTYLEATSGFVVSLQPNVGRAFLTVAGTLLASPSFYTIFEYGSGNTVVINVLSSGYMGGGGILQTSSATRVTNAGILSGYDAGIQTGSLADQIVNSGIIDAGMNFALNLADGNDRATNSGQIIGNVILGVGNDSFYGRGGAVTGAILLGDGNDLIDLRNTQVSGDITGGVGDDIFVVDDTAFSLVENASQGTDLVKSTVSFELGDNFENLQLLGAGDLDGTGNILANMLRGNAGDNRLNGFSGSDILYGGAGDDWLFGDTGNDSLFGGIGNDVLNGGASNDVLTGDSGEDRLIGGGSRDTMTGDVGTAGGYADLFIYQKISDSPNSAFSDRIVDFRTGEDKIDLVALDARTTTAANEAFTFINTAFTNVAGQLRIDHSGSDTYVLGDVTGDGVADFRIILTGNLTLTPDDFLL